MASIRTRFREIFKNLGFSDTEMGTQAQTEEKNNDKTDRRPRNSHANSGNYEDINCGINGIKMDHFKAESSEDEVESGEDDVNEVNTDTGFINMKTQAFGNVWNIANSNGVHCGNVYTVYNCGTTDQNYANWAAHAFGSGNSKFAPPSQGRPQANNHRRQQSNSSQSSSSSHEGLRHSEDRKDRQRTSTSRQQSRTSQSSNEGQRQSEVGGNRQRAGTRRQSPSSASSHCVSESTGQSEDRRSRERPRTTSRQRSPDQSSHCTGKTEGVRFAQRNCTLTQCESQKRTSQAFDDDEFSVEMTIDIQALLNSRVEPTYKYLDYISWNLGSDWQQVFELGLGINKKVIETSVVAADGHGIRKVADARKDLLRDWMGTDDDGTLGKLTSQLWEAGEKIVVKELAEIYKKDNEKIEKQKPNRRSDVP